MGLPVERQKNPATMKGMKNLKKGSANGWGKINDSLLNWTTEPRFMPSMER